MTTREECITYWLSVEKEALAVGDQDKAHMARQAVERFQSVIPMVRFGRDYPGGNRSAEASAERRALIDDAARTK